jgi:hypothetical protein
MKGARTKCGPRLRDGNQKPSDEIRRLVGKPATYELRRVAASLERGRRITRAPRVNAKLV